jgi:hypothetical protein
MNKKLIVLILMSVFLVSVFAVGVNAGITKTLKENEFLKWIFYDMTEGLVATPAKPEAIIMARALIGILVLSLIFGVSSTVLGTSMSKNARIGASIAVGLIASAAIPQAMIIGIYAAWSGIIAIGMIGGPVIGIFYLVYTQFEEGNRANYFAKFILMLIAAWVTSIGAVTDPTTVSATASGYAKILGEYFQSVLGWLSLVIYISMAYYLYKTVSPKAAVVETGAAKIGGKGLNWLSRRFNKSIRRLAKYDFIDEGWDNIKIWARTAGDLAHVLGTLTPTTTWPHKAKILGKEKEFKDKDALEKEVKTAGSKVVGLAEKAIGAENRVGSWTEYLWTVIKKVEDEKVRGELEKDTEEMIAADKAVIEKMKEIKEAAETAVTKAHWSVIFAKGGEVDKAKTLSGESRSKFLNLKAKLQGANLMGRK